MKMEKRKILVSVLGVILVLTGFVSAHLGEDEGMHHEGMMGGMGGMMYGGYGYSGMFFGWAFGLLILVALILLIVWLIKQIQKK